MRNYFYYEQFKKTLTPDQQQVYENMDSEDQKDWYIQWLEQHHTEDRRNESIY